MAAADGLILPNWNPLQTGVAFGTFVLNETTDYFAVLFRAPNTNAIERCFVNVSAISGGPTLEVSLQGVSSGVPDGTIKASGNAKKQYTATAAASWQTLDSSYTPTRGELLAYVVKLVSGTSATINSRIGGTTSFFPVGITFDNATSTKTLLTTPPVWGIASSGTDWVYGNPISSATSTNITTASIIESGAVFTGPSWGTMQLIGVRIFYRMNASSTAEIRVYSGNGAADTTVAQSITVDSTELQATGSQGSTSFFFPAVSVSPSAGFRITSRTTAGTVVEFNNTVLNAEDLKAYGPWLGNAYRTRRTTGNWTDTTTVGVPFEPIFDDVTVSGGGGSVALPVARAI